MTARQHDSNRRRLKHCLVMTRKYIQMMTKQHKREVYDKMTISCYDTTILFLQEAKEINKSLASLPTTKIKEVVPKNA